MLFDSERLYVRYFTEADADDFYIMNSDEEIMRYIRAPKTREETDIFLKETIAAYEEGKILRMALIRKSDEKFVGSFAIIPLKGSEGSQIGYALLKEFWGLGYAAEITQAGIKYVFEILEMDSISAVTEIPNTASQKVLLRNGFIEMHDYVEDGKQLRLFKISNSTNA